jgi:hypothetical protein
MTDSDRRMPVCCVRMVSAEAERAFTPPSVVGQRVCADVAERKARQVLQRGPDKPELDRAQGLVVIQLGV